MLLTDRREESEVSYTAYMYIRGETLEYLGVGDFAVPERHDELFR